MIAPDGHPTRADPQPGLPPIRPAPDQITLVNAIQTIAFNGGSRCGRQKSHPNSKQKVVNR